MTPKEALDQIGCYLISPGHARTLGLSEDGNVDPDVLAILTLLHRFSFAAGAEAMRDAAAELLKGCGDWLRDDEGRTPAEAVRELALPEPKP